MAKAYRFHGLAALNTESGTVYLPACEARKLAKALAAVARSIGRESFGESNVNGPDVADYRHAPDGHNVAALLAAGQIRIRAIKPGTWRAFHRSDKGAHWRPVRSAYGPINYTSPRAAYAAAAYEGGRA